MIKKLILVLGILSLLVIVGCSDSNTNNNYDTNNNQNSGNNDALAQCLNDNGAVMYGTEWCSHCKNQKAAFGDSFQYIDYVDCDRNNAACEQAGINGYPTWQIAGQNYPGEQPLERLATLAGCE